jgi:hypothetical protein
MERARSAPDKPTEYFPPMITVVNIGGDNVGSPIQAGSPAAHQSAVVQAGIDLPAARKIVAAYEAHADDLSRALAADDAALLQADMATVSVQLDSPKPNENTVREHLRSARAILTGNATAGAVAGGLLLDMLQHIHL